MSYFVILRSPTRGDPLPLINLEDEIVLFDDRKEAEEAGARNIIGEAAGFQVYEWCERGDHGE